MDLDAADLSRPVDLTPETCLSMREVLQEISERGPVTPRDIAQNRLRESVIRLHCYRLHRLQFVDEHGTGLFQITPKGLDVLENRENLRATYAKFVRSLNDPLSRITDLSLLDSYQVKETNLNLFEDPGQDYGLLQGDQQGTRQKIQNVKGHRLYRVFREFPLDEPLISQCAHWMRTFAGIHFFPDANHRTGMLLLEAILKFNEIDASLLPGRYIIRAVLRSKLLRILHVDSISLRSLWKKDEYYVHWFRYFRNVFCDTRTEYSTECSIDRLRDSLKAARGYGRF